MKLSYSKFLVVGLGLVIMTGCKSLPVVNRYQYVEVMVDDLPRLEKIEGIFVMNHYHPEMAGIMILIGDQDKVEQIIGREINPEKVVSDTAWIKRIYQHYLEAKRIKQGCLSDARVTFITKERAYMIKLSSGYDEKVVYGDDYESEKLREDFEELGLLEREEPSDTKEVLEYFKK